VTLPIQVGPSTITMNRDDRFVVCQPDGRIERLAEEGFFARDTRFVSGYEVFLNGQRPALLNASPVQFYSSRFEYTNPELLDRDGVVPRHSLGMRIDRTVSGGVHGSRWRGGTGRLTAASAAGGPLSERVGKLESQVAGLRDAVRKLAAALGEADPLGDVPD